MDQNITNNAVSLNLDPSESKKQFSQTKPHFNTLRIADLELFITAAKTKNLSEASRVHYLSQSAASTAVQRLERALGLPLCKHEKKRFGLTYVGEQLLPKLENWLEELKGMVSYRQEALPLRIATTHALAKMALEPILSAYKFELSLMRPDEAYGAVIKGQADIAIVLDNAPWEGLEAEKLAEGSFQLFSSKRGAVQGPVIIPEDQIEVLALKRKWLALKGQPLEIKARIPSWSLIADICGSTDEIGFLPEFLAMRKGLYPVDWQPDKTFYSVLAIYRKELLGAHKHFDTLILKLKKAFSPH